MIPFGKKWKTWSIGCIEISLALFWCFFCIFGTYVVVCKVHLAMVKQHSNKEKRQWRHGTSIVNRISVRWDFQEGNVSSDYVGDKGIVANVAVEIFDGTRIKFSNELYELRVRQLKTLNKQDENKEKSEQEMEGTIIYGSLIVGANVANDGVCCRLQRC